VAQRLIGRRVRAVEREALGRVDLGAGFGRHLIGLLRRQHAGGNQPGTHPQQRVGPPCRLVFVGRPEHRDRLVLGEMQRHAGRGDDVAVRAEPVDL